MCSEEGKHRDFFVEFMTDEEQRNKLCFSISEGCYGKEGPSLFSMGQGREVGSKDGRFKNTYFNLVRISVHSCLTREFLIQEEERGR